MSDPRIVFITGATDGLGRALALRCAAEGDRLILHGRDPRRLATFAGELQANFGMWPATVLADLADLAQVRRMADEVAALGPHLDVFVSNAGIGSGEPDGRTRRESVDGHELRFAVNYLAGFLITERLLPWIEAAPQGRVVNVASLGQSPLNFGDLMLTNGYDGSRAYGQSKLAQIISGFELANRLDRSPVTVNSLHPSTFMPTKMVMQEVGHSIDSIEQGVDATHWVMTDPDLANVSGQFFDRKRAVRANEQAYDLTVRATLRARSMELVGLRD